MTGNALVEYTIKGQDFKFEVKTKLKPVEGMLKPLQNIYYGTVTLNGEEYDHPGAEYYVNAQYLAEEVANIEFKKLRAEHGRSLRLKRK